MAQKEYLTAVFIDGTSFDISREKLEDKMNLLKNKPLLRTLLMQGDSLNTMNGGISRSSVNTYKTEEAYVIMLSAPTVSPESFNVYLDYNTLIVYSLLNKDIARGQRAAIPMFNRRFELPIDADLENIEAVHEEGKLKIVVPYKSDNAQFKRRIDIREL